MLKRRSNPTHGSLMITTISGIIFGGEGLYHALPHLAPAWICVALMRLRAFAFTYLRGDFLILLTVLRSV